ATCSGALTVTTKDANNNVSNVTSNTTVNLTGGGSGVFYSDSSCTGGNNITTRVINSGSSSATYYFKDSTAESLTLSVDNGGGLTAGTFGLTVNPGSPTKFILTGTSPITAATCSGALTVTTKDA